jgi:carbamoyltransferase
MERELRHSSFRWRYCEHIGREIAKRVAAGKVVARFDGPMEYGPRALGNRSILVCPTDPGVNQWLNQRLKRTEFMPFAPVILQEEAHRYFHGSAEASYPCSFMTVTLDATELCRREAPAVVHIDGTARPQFVSAQSNPGLYRILQEYEKTTGLPLMINTSFNMHEEPIVCTPMDALRAFQQGHLDYLALGPFLVEGKEGPIRNARAY